ncbi:MAG: cytochrome C oxidase subunit IV family protein [Planctomycetota bacterium]
MSDSHDGLGFNANKVFIILFILTAVEVGWALIDFPRWALWGGLLTMAFMKGFLIFAYFMHMKFEGWIVKCLIAPTPLLMLIAVFALMPDVSHNSRLVNPVGSMISMEDGTLQQLGEIGQSHGEEGDGHDSGH